MANDQVKLTGLESIQSSDTTLTDDLVVTDQLTVNGKAVLGDAVSDSVGFYGNKVSQRRSASQTIITTLTGGKTTTNVAAKLNLLIKYNMRTRLDMVAMGIIKGAA